MDVYRQGKKVRLTQAEFKAQGGEGAVYVAGDTAYKVYADPAKMIPIAKIKELSALELRSIVRPQDILLDAGRTPIGYTMQSVPDSVVLCSTFTPAFKQRVGLTPEKVLHLVKQFQEGIAYVHSRGILIVDLNEMNFLVDLGFKQIYFIDVDSYQTPHFPATALMESVRDRQASGWNSGTDWFSFAVVSFQMFAGIHPYKGRHPSVKTLDARMQQSLSVFHPDVSLPGVCPPLSGIPRAYFDWYRAVFEQGERTAPPSGTHIAVSNRMVLTPTPAGSGHFTISKWHELAGTIVSFTRGFTVTTEAVYSETQRCRDVGANVVLGLSPVSRSGVLAFLEHGCVSLFDLTRQKSLPFSMMAEQLRAADGRVYAKQGGSLLEVSFVETPTQVWASAKIVGTVLEHATQLFEGVALQNLLGAWYASLLPETAHCYQVKLPELDGFQVIHAKFEGGVLMVVAAKAGRFQKLIFRFSCDYSTYDVRVISDIATYGINFVVLDSGLCLHLSGEGDLEIFPAKQGASALKMFTDPALGGDSLLLKDGSQALFARDNTLYRLARE